MSWKDQYASYGLVETRDIAGSEVAIVSDLGHDYIFTQWEKFVSDYPQAKSNPTFVNLNLKFSNQPERSRFRGLEVLRDLVAEEPNRFTLVFSAIPSLWEVVSAAHAFNRNGGMLNILEQHPMTQYLNIVSSFSESVLTCWERALEFSLRQSMRDDTDWITPGEVLVFGKEYKHKVSRLIHDLGYRYQETLNETLELFPEAPDDFSQAIEFLREWQEKPEIPPAIKGKKVRGLFVDAAGTLFDSELKILNKDLWQEVVEQSKIRWVYIWTGGDLKRLDEALDNQNIRDINIVILPKQIFSGLTAEETIDDLSQKELENEFGIRTLKHSCVS